MSHTKPTAPAAPTDAQRVFDVVEAPLEPSGSIVALRGDIDLATAPGLRQRLHTLVEAGTTRLLLDLRGVTFMDSVALATVLHGRRLLGDDGCMAVVVPDGSYTRLLFEAAGLPSCLELFNNLGDAAAHLAANAAHGVSARPRVGQQRLQGAAVERRVETVS
jgi:anti-sigma B factor antagonist